VISGVAEGDKMGKRIILSSIFIAAVFTLIFLLNSCAQKVPEGAITDQEYKVYSDLLPELVRAKDAKGLFVIEEETSSINKDGRLSFDEKTMDYIESQSGTKLDSELASDFKKKIAKPAKFEKKFDKGLNVIFVTEKEIEDIFSDMDRGWDNFYLKFPNSFGTIELSRVAFDKDKNHALFYFGNQSDWLAGIGFFVIAVKEEGKWKILSTTMAWIS
jgi:hypothetical protein